MAKPTDFIPEEGGHDDASTASAGDLDRLEQAFALAESASDKTEAAKLAVKIGDTYLDDPELCDLDQAESWYSRCLDLKVESNLLERTIYARLGLVAYKKVQKACRHEGSDKDDLMELVEEAIRINYKALELLPLEAASEYATIHRQLGELYHTVELFDHAAERFLEAVRWDELQGNHLGASRSRLDAAFALLLIDPAGRSRLPEALACAQAALRGFESCEESTAKDLKSANEVIGILQQGSGSSRDGVAEMSGPGMSGPGMSGTEMSGTEMSGTEVSAKSLLSETFGFLFGSSIFGGAIYYGLADSNGQDVFSDSFAAVVCGVIALFFLWLAFDRFKLLLKKFAR